MLTDAAFLLRFHAWFALIAAATLAPCLLQPTFPHLKMPPHSYGLAVCFLVLAWHLALALLTTSRPHLCLMWRFVATLSVFMVVPDWFLVRALGTLEFPDNGAWKIGSAVSVYMAGMWSIPLMCLLACCTLANRTANRFVDKANIHPHSCRQQFVAPLRAAAIALLIFGGAEQLSQPLRLWSATANVKRTAGHVALYVLPAEALLGAVTLLAYRATGASEVTGWSTWMQHVVAAAAVAVMYTGALAVSYLFVEL